ncbi:zinc finger protein 287-like [Condylostylus longicornis]|uniref:zinc finger protein 287-like n=1 Tax=Condylostylus longicornis TaxID=2530218 RepID=UPI00244E152B|nr:zinc finger protein 287-like [Condylostylus longicornis]
MEISIESCRVCLRDSFCVDKKERWESVSLSDVDIDEISFAEKYFTCTGIKVSETSRFGQKICYKCLQFLRKMYTFLKICLRTDNILQKHIARENIKEYAEVKIEPKTEGNSLWEEEYFENLSPESIKIEICEVDVPKHRVVGKELFNVVELPDIDESHENYSQESLTNYIQNYSREKEEESFICEICGNIYKKRYLLEKHVTTHSDKKEYECEICGKAFQQQQYLSAHIKRHSGVRKYNCSFCSRKFYTKGKLTEHERVHRGERIYKCKYCDSSFFYGHNLKRHQLCHTGLKPYLCKHCHKTFRTKSNLDQHFRTDVHKDESTRTYSILTQ